MDTQISLSSLIAGVGTICGIAGFIISQLMSIAKKGKSDGVLASNIEHMQQTITDLTKSVDTLISKTELKEEKHEQEYRAILVQLTENKTEISILKQEVSSIKSFRSQTGSCE